MRANSATVPKICAWVSGIKIHSYRLYYSILYSIIMPMIQKVVRKSEQDSLKLFQNDSQNEPDGANMRPKWPQKWARWGQNEAKFDKVGPKLSREGPQKGQGHKRNEKRGSPPWKNDPFWSQKEVKIHQKTCLKTWWFSSRSLDRFWNPFYTKMVPQRVKFETKIDQKIASCQKNEFSLPYSENQWILMNLRVWGLHFWC